MAVIDNLDMPIVEALRKGITPPTHGINQEYNDIEPIGEKIVEGKNGKIENGRGDQKTLIQLSETDNSKHITITEKTKLSGIEENAQVNADSRKALTVVTTISESVTQLGEFFSVRYTTTGEPTITIPTVFEIQGNWFTVKDTGNNSFINKITITCETVSRKIELSMDDFIIQDDGSSYNFIYEGSGWWVF